MFYRGRRLRENQVTRSLMCETHLHVEQLIYPIFVVEGTNIKQEISSLPGVYHYSIDCLKDVIAQMNEVGLKACILFGIPEHKDSVASEAYAESGILQQAIREIKRIDPDMFVIGDVCMCEYTDHGHCGIIDEHGHIDNDQTLPYLQKITLSYAMSGVDMVAPSAMMDGQILAMRQILDENGYYQLPIMGYSAKFASAYYGPFRDAADSAPQFGDRRAYQMDPANSREAMKEVELDMEEGADFIMVKPALCYLDIVRQVRDKIDRPIAVYNVSGEYSMVKAAAQNGWIDEKRIVMETLLSMKRAGADIIITYHAIDVAKWLKG